MDSPEQDEIILDSITLSVDNGVIGVKTPKIGEKDG